MSVFYISCRGSGATHWLTKSLSKHSKIVCFHSSRSFPPMEPGKTHLTTDSWLKDEMDVDKYIESLELCEKATHNEKVFGSIHGYHGIIAKDSCLKRNGVFRYIIRDPLEQIHSAFIAYCDRKWRDQLNKKIKNEDIHKHVFELLKDQPTLSEYTSKYYKRDNDKIVTLNQGKDKKLDKYYLRIKNKFFSNKNMDSHSSMTNERITTQLFVNLLNEFFFTNNELFNNCPSNYGLKMEELVKDKNSYSNFIKSLSEEIEVTDEYLNNVFNSNRGRFNIHRKIPIKADEIWNSWPLNFKNYYRHYFEYYKISKICDNFSYNYSFL